MRKFAFVLFVLAIFGLGASPALAEPAAPTEQAVMTTMGFYMESSYETSSGGESHEWLRPDGQRSYDRVIIKTSQTGWAIDTVTVLGNKPSHAEEILEFWCSNSTWATDVNMALAGASAAFDEVIYGNSLTGTPVFYWKGSTFMYSLGNTTCWHGTFEATPLAPYGTAYAAN